MIPAPYPDPGVHGGGGFHAAGAAGLHPGSVLDLSASLCPVAPDPARVVSAHLDALGRYPDPAGATAALASVMGVHPGHLLLTNGGAEAIALLGAVIGGSVEEPEFSLYPRGGGPRWRSNPNNPLGTLAGPADTAGVWDEAFWPLATGTWTRGDHRRGSVVVGSLTKLLACPGLRAGYVLSTDSDLVDRLRRTQPMWSVNGLVADALPALLGMVDLPAWSKATAALRDRLATLLAGYGLDVRTGQGPWVLVEDACDLPTRLLACGVVIRDCSSFGLAGTVRIAVPREESFPTLGRALDTAMASQAGTWPSGARRAGSGRGADHRPQPVTGDPVSPVQAWPRPVLRIGDTSSALERAGDPTGWAMPPAVRDALYEVVSARRDIRRFRPDPVPEQTLDRVLSAAHAAPSVGHSQPWRFLVVRDGAIRDAAAVLTDRERLRQAALLEPDAGRHLLDLQLEGVREAPMGVVVCCDRRSAAGGVLGRATFPDADLWSCAAAIENLWLAARAEGLGVGWVTLFRPEDLGTLLGLPDGVVSMGWLCIGWPDERPPAPGLERAAWSRRLPLADVVLTDGWPAGGASPPPPRSRLRAPGPHAVVDAHDEADRLLAPPSSLGVLDRAVDRVVALGRAQLRGGVLVMAGADHPVAAHRVSAYDPGVTRDVLSAAVAGVALGAIAARGAGLGLIVVDAGVNGAPVPGATALRPRRARGDLISAPAMTTADAESLVEAGCGLGRALGTAGLVALGEVGIANTTVAAALTCWLLDADVEGVTGRGTGIDASTLADKRAIVTGAVHRVHGAHGAHCHDPMTGMAELGGPELAVLTGVTLGAAQSGAVVVLDGLAVSIAAAVAVSIEPSVQHCLVAGQRSRERGHALVLEYLGCEPLLDLRIRAGEGAGACLAAGLLLDGLRIRRETARVLGQGRQR